MGTQPFAGWANFFRASGASEVKKKDVWAVHERNPRKARGRSTMSGTPGKGAGLKSLCED